MSFNTDKQTLSDLNIFGKLGAASVFRLYNDTSTRGGADILEKMFLYPLDKMELINDRSNTIKYFMNADVVFPFRTDLLDSAEIYLSITDPRTKLSVRDNGLLQKFNQLIVADGDFKLINNGVVAILELLLAFKSFGERMKSSASRIPYYSIIRKSLDFIEDEHIAPKLNEKYISKLSFNTIADCDALLRFQMHEKLKLFLDCIYHCDVFISVARVASKYKYVFPEAFDRDRHFVEFTDVYHPLVSNAIPNSIDLTPDSNVVFLTGANMAGKSTLMKSLGIALYLAHLGFPVAAKKMNFSVRDGMYTTINLPDDLSKGNSHFYAEVLRIKKIAKELAAGKELFIIFDELFRGTNVKDAYEGTVAVTEAIAKRSNCLYIVSTHIIEAGEVLGQRCGNIKFIYMPTKMEKNVPVYPYKLEYGITEDRHGMVIINNEKILEIIQSRKTKTLRS